MAFQVSLILTADGDVAAAEVRKVGTAAKEAGAHAEQLGSKGRAAAGGVQKVGQSADRAEDQVKKLAAAERKAARDAAALDRSNQRAAGATGNLIAQFNDVGVMMMAGQNPLQLAVQQGTQITQVIGPMGAAGAVRSLGAALLGMLNPINLVTIGAIAAGAAMVNWLTGSREEMQSLGDLIAETQDRLKAFDAAQRDAGLGALDMVEKFGTADPVLKTILADFLALKKADLYESLASQASAVRDLVLELSWFDERSAQSASQDFLGIGNMSSSAREAGAQFASNLELLKSSEEPAVKLKAALDVRQQLLDAAGGLDNLNTEQREFYDALAATIRDLVLIGAKVDDIGAKLKDASKGRDMATALSQELAIMQAIGIHGEDAAEVENLRLGFARELFQAKLAQLDLLEEEKAKLRELWDANEAEKRRIASEAEQKSAEDLLATLREQNAIQEAINRHGRDSAEVAQLRAQAERRAFKEMVDALPAADDLKQQIMAAFDEGQKLASLDMKSGISVAADEALRLARNLNISLAEAMGIMNLRSSKVYSGRGGNPQDFMPGGSKADYDKALDYVPVDKIIERFERQGGGGRGKQTDALSRLIEREQEQLDLLRETDPVQKEMLRNREALAGATDAERAAVEALIGQRIAEQEAMDNLRERQDFFNQTAYDALDGLILKGESLEDVLQNIALALAEAALQAAIFGNGPLASLFGWTTPLFGFAAGGEIPALAEGGQIYGPGGGTDDKVLMWGSSGEFMMNAKATARYRHLLEAMNAGVQIPGFANGGAVSGAPSSVAAAGGVAHLRVALSEDLKAELLTQSAGISAEITQGQLESYDQMLPRRFKEISDDPGRIG